MIKLTRLNGNEIWINAAHIKFLESTPDTLIWLTDGDRINVREAPDQVVSAVLEYGRSIHNSAVREQGLTTRPAGPD